LNEAVKQFAAYLSTIKDDSERAREIARAKMMAVNSAEEAIFEPPIRTLRDYLAAEIEIPPVLIHPFMCVRGGLNTTVGRAGKGKTVMALNRNLRWAAGLPWLEDWMSPEGDQMLYPDQPLRILIVENEGAAGMFHRQIGLMLNAEGYLNDEQRELARDNILIWGEGGYSHMKLDDPAKLNGLRAGIEKWEPDLVFIEPFRSLWSGEENSATEMSVVTDALVGIATDYNCGVWAAHHEKKGGSGEDDKMSAARGSTALEAIVTVMENFESAKGGDFREVTWSKSRYEKAPNPVRLEWDHEAWWYKHVPNEAIEETIIAELTLNPEPMSITDLHEATEESKKKLRDACKKMIEHGRLKAAPSIQTGAGTTGPRYRLPTDDTDEYGGLPV
jgi:RecA-family ATPase